MAEKKEGTSVEYAGFWIRLLAYVVDFIILWLIYAVLSAFFWVFTFPFWIWSWAGWGGFHPLWVPSFPTLLIAAAYFTTFWAWRGETPGMMALRLRIYHENGTRLKWDWNAALLRLVGYIVCWITLGLLFLWIAFDERKQGIHDKMASTYVVILPPKKAVIPERAES